MQECDRLMAEEMVYNAEKARNISEKILTAEAGEEYIVVYDLFTLSFTITRMMFYLHPTTYHCI